MAAPKGHPQWGGRAKGTPNKKTQNLIEKAEELGVDPFEILLLFAKADWKSLGYPAPTKIKFVTEAGQAIEEDVISSDLRVQAAKEACQYIHPKRKAVEHSGEIKNPYLEMPLNELEALVKKKIKK